MLLSHRAGVITVPPQSDHKGRFTCRAYAYNLDKVSVHLAAPIGGPKELRRILNGQGNLHAANLLFSLMRSHLDDKDGRVITRPPLIQCQGRFQNAIGDLLGAVTPYSGFIKRWATFIQIRRTCYIHRSAAAVPRTPDTVREHNRGQSRQ